MCIGLISGEYLNITTGLEHSPDRIIFDVGSAPGAIYVDVVECDRPRATEGGEYLHAAAGFCNPPDRLVRHVPGTRGPVDVGGIHRDTFRICLA